MWLLLSTPYIEIGLQLAQEAYVQKSDIMLAASSAVSGAEGCVMAESCDKIYCRKWLDTHLKDQWYMGKPVVIEEFGKAIGKSPVLLRLLCTL